MQSNERSAEMFSRVRMMASGHDKWDLSDNDTAALRHVLAAAEARESGEQAIKPDWSDAMAHAISGRVSPGTVTVNDGTPSAAEVIEACWAALGAAEGAVLALQKQGQFGVNYQWSQDVVSAVVTDELHPALALIARWKEANGGK